MKADLRATLPWICSAFIATAMVIVCVLYLDVPVGLFVKKHLYGNLHWYNLTSHLPDLLLLVVLLVTFTTLSIYIIRSKKGIYDDLTAWAKLTTWSGPASYLIKNVLKFIFGRVNTRNWVHDPDLYTFHWFNSGDGFEGFPSGHMVVMVTLFAAIGRFFPRCRVLCIGTGIALGVALVATNYHFLSDVIAGAYCGILIEALLFRILLDNRRESGYPAI